MAGLVPAIHVWRHRGAGRERARRRSDVDARNESGHDGGRDAGVPETVPMIRALSAERCIPADILIGEYTLA